MYDPTLHLNTSANSWKFDKVPITLKNIRKRYQYLREAIENGGKYFISTT